MYNLSLIPSFCPFFLQLSSQLRVHTLGALGIIHNPPHPKKRPVYGKVAPPEKGCRCLGGGGPEAGTGLGIRSVWRPVSEGLPGCRSILPAGGLPGSGRCLLAGGIASAERVDLPGASDCHRGPGIKLPAGGKPRSEGGEACGGGSGAGRRCRVLLRCNVTPFAISPKL
ncbi:hypothetical protein C8R46DRAFT_1191974 [Mycena filopes]|nr:hypothetical protein C8R46DRAFT_1191974 [Mycena filopes]